MKPDRLTRWKCVVDVLKAHYPDLVVEVLDHGESLVVWRKNMIPAPLGLWLEDARGSYSLWDLYEARGHQKDWIVSQVVAMLRDKHARKE